jgi:hypothetical protein
VAGAERRAHLRRAPAEAGQRRNGRWIGDALRVAAAACLALGSAGGGAVPPPLPQTGADCERPTYASDQLACSDPALRALDEQVRDAWLALVATGPSLDIPAAVETQVAWFRRRSLCAFSERHGACLRAAYAERAAVLEAWRLALATSAAGHGTRLRCVGAPWGTGVVLGQRRAGGPLTVTDAAGRPLAIAVPDAARDDWEPFLRFDADGLGGFRLLPHAGSGVVCVAE